MNIRFTYHLTGGKDVVFLSSDYGSLDAAVDVAKHICQYPNTSVSLNGANGVVQVVNSNHIVSVTVEKAEG